VLMCYIGHHLLEIAMKIHMLGRKGDGGNWWYWGVILVCAQIG
jgi:hypothetical protein